jgi:hypothetical protein
MLFKFALIGGAAYLIYTLLMKGASAAAGIVGAATAPATTALANAYVALTSAGQMIPQGAILLPDGVTWVAVASVAVTPYGSGNAAQFTYNGTTYYLLTGHDSNGNYQAYATPNG